MVSRLTLCRCRLNLLWFLCIHRMDYTKTASDPNLENYELLNYVFISFYRAGSIISSYQGDSTPEKKE